MVDTNIRSWLFAIYVFIYGINLSRDPIGVCNLRESLPVGSWVKLVCIRQITSSYSEKLAWPEKKLKKEKSCKPQAPSSLTVSIG